MIEPLFRTAVALQRDGREPEAEGLWRRVLAIRPDLADARSNLALCLLAQGKYAEGFPLYEARFERTRGRVPRPSLPFPEWRGEPLAGRTVLVWGEQGFGDQILFARFAPLLAQAGARVALVAAPSLVRLFGCLPAQVLEAGRRFEMAPPDVWIMLGSLPARLGVTRATVPAAPYLPSRPGGAGVGVMTQASPSPPGRSLPPELAAELLGRPGAVSLAPEDSGAKDFQDTAEIIAGLERVITVDTAVAHLAGAMGKPVDVLLPHVADWRWLREGQDTPWYPTARLHRQPAPGDWRTLVERVGGSF